MKDLSLTLVFDKNIYCSIYKLLRSLKLVLFFSTRRTERSIAHETINRAIKARLHVLGIYVPWVGFALLQTVLSKWRLFAL